MAILMLSKKTMVARSLHVVVNEAERNKEQDDPGDGVDADDEDAEHGEEAREEDVEDEGEAVVHRAEVAGEPVENLSERCEIKEQDLGSHHSFDQFGMDCLGSTDPSVGKQESSHETKDGVGDGNDAVDSEVVLHLVTCPDGQTGLVAVM